jgi:hypothetical protein
MLQYNVLPFETFCPYIKYAVSINNAVIQDMLAAVSDSIKSAVCMIDGELKDSSEILDAFGKKKPKASRKGGNTGEVKTVNITLYIPCVSLQSATHFTLHFTFYPYLSGLLKSHTFPHRHNLAKNNLQRLSSL